MGAGRGSVALPGQGRFMLADSRPSIDIHRSCWERRVLGTRASSRRGRPARKWDGRPPRIDAGETQAFPPREPIPLRETASGRAPGAYNHQDERSRMERDGPRQAGSPTVGSSVQDGSDGRGAEWGRVHFRAAPGSRGRADRGCRLPLRPRSGQRTGAGEPGAAGRQGVPHGVGGLADRRAVRQPARPSPVREAPSCTTTNRPCWTPSSEAR